MGSAAKAEIGAAYIDVQEAVPIRTLLLGPQHAPHSWEKPTYGAHVQYAPDDEYSPLLPAKKINLVQQIVGTLLYYSITANPNILTALGSISAQQAKGTEKTYADTLWLLNYAATHPNATIKYTASDMILHIHSDASCLSKL